MNRFENRLVNHSLRGTMTSLREALEGLPEEVLQAAEQNGREGAVTRASALLDYLDGLLAAADPRLVAQSTLDAIHGHVDQALIAVNALAEDPATRGADLDQAVENGLQQTAALVAATAGFAESAQKLGRKSGGFTVKVKKLEGEAEMIAEELEQLESRRKVGLEEFTNEQEERRSELAGRLDEVQTAIDSERERVNTLSETFEGQLNDVIGELKERSDKTAEDLATEAEQAKGDFSQRAEDALGEIDGIREKINDLYSVITDTSTAGAFHDEAKEQAEAADRWRRMTVGFGTGAAVIAVASVVISAFSAVSAPVIFAKIAATLACVAVAAYAGKQSAHHRTRADQAKDLELELVATEGFMHSLHSDEQRSLRSGYFERAFRGRSAASNTSSANEDAAAFGLTPEVLAALVALLKASESPSR